ncbi:MAG: hypothetical protein ICV73_28280 [Acetobacteraceae bacterium]|nr:hypothetical protein [Acetobacteraceae bacterium]
MFDVDAANPPPLTEPQRRLFAEALVLLADETRAEILAAAEARSTVAFDTEWRKTALEMEARTSEAYRIGLVGAVQAWSMVEQVTDLPTSGEAGKSRSASRPGRKPKGDVRMYGALLCLYEQVTGRPARGDKDTIAFVRSFAGNAGPTFAAAELGSIHPPSGKTADKRWNPLSTGAFRRRLKQFEAAKAPARALDLIQRAEEERKK